MVFESIKRFLSNPFYYLRSPAETVRRVRDVINGSWLCMHERKRIYGCRNRDKVFYVIRPGDRYAGLMSIHNYVLRKIEYAVEKGYIPVIDYQNYENMYLDRGGIFGEANSWEYFFQQPTQWSLGDIKHSRHVIICDRYLPGGYEGVENGEDIAKLHEIIEKYCILREDLAEKIQLERDALFPKGTFVLGVLGRGTDYSSLKPSKHPIVPDIELLVETVREKKKLWGYEYVYLATEDNSIYQAMKNEFGEKLIAYETPRFEHTVKSYLADIDLQQVNKRQRGEDYLITIYLLSQCDALIGPAVGGTVAAIRINGGKFKHKYIFHLGFYD